MLKEKYQGENQSMSTSPVVQVLAFILLNIKYMVIVLHMESNLKFPTQIYIFKIAEASVKPHQQNYASSPWQFSNNFYSSSLLLLLLRFRFSASRKFGNVPHVIFVTFSIMAKQDSQKSKKQVIKQNDL